MSKKVAKTELKKQDPSRKKSSFSTTYLTKTKIIGIALLLLGIIFYHVLPTSYGFIGGALSGAGLGVFFFFGKPKK